MTNPRHIAVIAGSGMGAVADAFDVEETTPFSDVDGVGACTVAGHSGEVRWCRRGEARVAVVLGRRHLYEGEPVAMRSLLAALRARGVDAVVVASAAGSLSGDLPPGEVVVVRDALDFQNRERFRPRGRDIPGAHTYDGRGAARLTIDLRLAQAVERACLAAGVRTSRGALACFSGPAYETPAEVAFSQFTGAALVTMSAAPEIAFANELGMPVAAIATITNAATGIGHSTPDHGEVVEIAGRACAGIARAIAQLIQIY